MNIKKAIAIMVRRNRLNYLTMREVTTLANEGLLTVREMERLARLQKAAA